MLLVLLAVLIVLLLVLPLLGVAFWTLLSIGFVGLIIGGLARLVLPGHQNIGVLATVLLGWIGSFVGGLIGYRVLHTGTLVTVLLEIAAAALFIGLYSRRSTTALATRGRSVNW